MTKEQSLNILGELFLVDPITKEDLVIFWPLINNGDGSHSIITMNTITGEKQEITYRIKNVKS